MDHREIPFLSPPTEKKEKKKAKKEKKEKKRAKREAEAGMVQEGGEDADAEMADAETAHLAAGDHMADAAHLAAGDHAAEGVEDVDMADAPAAEDANQAEEVPPA